MSAEAQIEVSKLSEDFQRAWQDADKIMNGLLAEVRKAVPFDQRAEILIGYHLRALIAKDLIIDIDRVLPRQRMSDLACVEAQTAGSMDSYAKSLFGENDNAAQETLKLAADAAAIIRNHGVFSAKMNPLGLQLDLLPIHFQLKRIFENLPGVF